MNNELYSVISDISLLMNDRDEINEKIKEQVQILWDEIQNIENKIPDAFFKYYNANFKVKMDIHYIVPECSDECYYSIFYTNRKLSDDLTIPRLVVNSGYSCYVVYYPDDILFKPIEEVKAFIDETSKKLNDIAAEKLRENEKAEEYKTYLKLKKKFE